MTFQPRKFLVADLLCGAGGSSTGCAQALRELGLDMELVCVNHWPTAIETHSKNHPTARHYCQDIATVRPHQVVPEGRLDLLMASPSCTHHSVARGGKPTSDQQRSDPWHIITWLTELVVDRIIIENVWEFRHWGPVDPDTGKPIKAKRGEYFRAWVQVLQQLGYALEWRKLNAADYGEATTRQRFFLIARKDGVPLAWPEATHSRNGEVAGTQRWRPAREIIDELKGRSIFNRPKPLAQATLERLFNGAVKSNWPEPFLVILRNHMDGKSVEEPLPTIAAGGTHIGLATPVIVNGRKNNRAKGVSDAPVPALDTKGGVWLAEPVVLSLQKSGRARSADEPLPTITTGGAGVEKRPGCGRPMLFEPFILSRHSENGSPRAPHSIDEPMPTADCRGAGYLVEPFVLAQASGGVGRSVDEPMPTVVTGGALALVSPYYSSGSGETCTTVEEPLPTATAKARFGLAVPITHAGGNNRARDVDIDPLPTITTAKRGEVAFVEGVDEPHYDILYRMLEDYELGAAMGFDGEDRAYEFVGNKTQKIKQIGNAVSVRQMKALAKALCADAARPMLMEAAE